MSAREELASLLLPQRIAHVITQAGLSQEDFGKAIGADRPRVNAWVRGRSGISPEYAQKIAAYASELYGEEIPADLFITDRRTPLEEAATQLAQTARDLSLATRALVDLLAEQRELVQRMQRVSLALEQRKAANGEP